MPRAGWLAAGAIGTAFSLPGLVASVPAGGDGPTGRLVGLIVVAVAATALGIAVAILRGGRARPAFLLLGCATIGLRVGLALLTGGAGGGPSLPTGDGTWHAIVSDVSSPHRAEQRALIEVRAVSLGKQTLPAEGVVYAWLPRHPRIIPGDRIEAEGRLQPATDDGSGFADYLRARGASGTVRSRTMRVVGHEDGLLPAVERLRWDIDGSLSLALPEPEAGLASGILIGLRERVTRDVVDDFTATGLTHVVAISGWNIALVAGIVTGLLRATGLGRRSRSVLVVAAILGYTLLAGAEASVIRAAAMGTVVLVARESGRPSGAAAALGLAAWALLVLDPSMVGDIGFQLSLAATAGLLALGGPAERAVHAVTRGRAPVWLSETLGVSLAAQLATLPLILVHFGRLSLISPFANLVIAPVVPLAMLGAVVAALAGGFLGAPVVGLLLTPVLLASWLPLAMMVRGGELMAGVPFASAALPFPLDVLGAALALVALIAAVRRVGGDRRARTDHLIERARSMTRSTAARPAHGRRVAIAVSCVVAVLGTSAIAVATRPGGMLHVAVLDVGQGDAILLEADDGMRVLVDGGGDPDLLVRRLDERIPIWDRRLDIVLLTHPHEDHVGGLGGLLPRYRVGVFAENGMRSDGSGYQAFVEQAERHGVAVVRLAQGDRFTIGRARADVVWPPGERVPETAPDSGREINDTSIVLDVRVGRQRLLLTGDIEEDMDRALLEAIETLPGRLDLFKVAHHGSATASSAPLLEALRPRIAAVSAGIGNTYGHPAPATLARLEAVGARVLRTDMDGTIALSFDGMAVADTATGAWIGPRPGPKRHARTASACPPAPSIRQAAWRLGRPSPGARAVAIPAAWRPCYPRPDAGPDSLRGHPAAHGPRAVLPARAARHRRGRGRLVPGVPRPVPRHPRRPTAGRDSRAPPRRRQGVPRR